MKIYHINSPEAIMELFADIQNRYKQPFDPVDDITCLIAEDGHPVFSKEEGMYLDDAILDCFVYCADHRLDIHDLAEAAQEELYSYSNCQTVGV